MILRARLLLASIAALAASVGALAQPAQEYELKAAFVYNFIQFTQWPEGALSSGTLNICASPGSPMLGALQGIAGKSSQGVVITLMPLQLERVSVCNVVVVDGTGNPRLVQLRKSVDNRPILIVSDFPEGLADGAIIAMDVDGSRIVFNIDNTRAVDVRLNISSRLLRLARNVR